MVRVRKLAAVPDTDSDSEDDLVISKVDTSIYGNGEDDEPDIILQQTPTRRRRGRPRKVQHPNTTIKSPQQQQKTPQEYVSPHDDPPVELSASGRPIRSVRKRLQSSYHADSGSPTPTTPRRPLKVTKLDVSLARKQIWTPKTPSSRLQDNLSTTSVGISPEKRLLFTPESSKKASTQTQQQDTPSSLSTTVQESTDALPTPPTTPSLHSPAKTLFHRGFKSKKLIGRETERQALSKFFDERLSAYSHQHDAQQSGCIYVSGPPGTGKSAVITEVIDSLDIKYPDMKTKVASVNCMANNRPQDIFIQIYEKFNDNGDDPFISVAESISVLTRQFRPLKPTTPIAHVLMLDEIDRLVTRDQEILYQLFDWAFDKSSNLIIVGIANALDLTDRFVYKIKSRLFTPQLLNFRPYSTDEIERIITDRLTYVEQQQVAMHPAAIQLCSRKTSQSTGDLRKAFDICRRAFELVEEQEQQRRQAGTVQTSLPMVTIAHISKLCSTVFGKSVAQRVKSLNLQQKAVLCSLVVSERKSGTSLSVEELYSNYCKLCLRDDLLDRLNREEFQDVITALDSVGAINLSSGPASGGGRNKKFGAAAPESGTRKISAAVREIDLLNAVGDIGILRRFFND